MTDSDPDAASATASATGLPLLPEQLEAGKRKPYTLCHFGGYPGIRPTTWCRWHANCTFMHFASAKQAIEYLGARDWTGINVASFEPLLFLSPGVGVVVGNTEVIGRLRDTLRAGAEQEQAYRAAIDERMNKPKEKEKEPIITTTTTAAAAAPGEEEILLSVEVNEKAMGSRRLFP